MKEEEEECEGGWGKEEISTSQIYSSKWELLQRLEEMSCLVQEEKENSEMAQRLVREKEREKSEMAERLLILAEAKRQADEALEHCGKLSNWTPGTE